jgi:hypothetical protein
MLEEWNDMSKRQDMHKSREVGRRRDSSPRIVTWLRDGRLRFDSQHGQEIFLFTTVSRPAMKLSQPPIQWVRGLFLRGKAGGV